MWTGPAGAASATSTRAGSTVRQIDLATLRVPVKRLHKVYAFNVNLFWVRECPDEVALLHERVLPGGGDLFYDASRTEDVPGDQGQGLRGARRRRLPGLRRREQPPRPWSRSSAVAEGYFLNWTYIRLFSNVCCMKVRTCRRSE